MEKIVTRHDLLKNSKRPTYAMERIARLNAMNRTGFANYNKYGEKNGVGFSPCTELFVDNFLLKVVVACYQINNNQFIHCGSVTKSIYESCHEAGLQPISAKAVHRCHQPYVTERSRQILLSYLQYRNPSKEAEMAAEGRPIKFFWQEFKVSCANLPMDRVLQYLRSEAYTGFGLFLKDIDFTIDLCGSFDKEEVKEYLIQNSGFRMAGSWDEQPRTILDNETKVGRNCLTFMEKINGYQVRLKFYDKMIQMLECKGVRQSVGQHIQSWVTQKDTRLASARDRSCERGLTRAEVTFYCCDGIPKQDKHVRIPRDDEIRTSLSRLIGYVPDTLVFCTPHAAKWKAFCETMKHSLIVVDKDRNKALLVYSYNQVTTGIGGLYIDDWQNNSLWCMSDLTLGHKLPIDVIEIAENEEISTFTLTGQRYFKMPKFGHDSVPTTRLVRTGAIFYSYIMDSTTDSHASRMHNEQLLQKAGLEANDAIRPLLAYKKVWRFKKPEHDLESMGQIKVYWQDELFQRRQREYVQRLDEAIGHMMEIARIREEKHRAITKIKTALREAKQRVENIPLGTHSLIAIRECEKRYVIVLDVCGQFVSCYPTKDVAIKIAETLENMTSQQKENLKEDHCEFLSMLTKPLATVAFEKHSYTPARNIVVHCQVVFSPELLQGSESEDENTETGDSTTESDMENVPMLNPLQIRCYNILPNLIDLPQGSIHTVLSMCHVLYRNKQRLVVKLDNETMYQAGRYLEENKEKLKKDCKIKIGKMKNEPSSRHKYAMCTIAQRDDWASLLEYNDLPLLNYRRGRGMVRVKDVAMVEVKRGVKRKLIRTDDDVVYRVKRTKKSDAIVPGTMV